jgi:hypothetical protein
LILDKSGSPRLFSRQILEEEKIARNEMAEVKNDKKEASKDSRGVGAVCSQLKMRHVNMDHRPYLERCGRMHCSEAASPFCIPSLYLLT